MKEKTITIVFPKGGIIPKDIAGTKADKFVPAQEPVKVPASYGEHLIHDRFAFPYQKADKPEKESGPSAKDLKDAQKAVDEAKAAVVAAGDDMVAKQSAEDALKSAEDALTNLKA